MCAAVGAVAAHGEKHVHVAGNEIVHRSADIDGTARGAKNRSAMLMTAINKCRRDLHRLNSARGIEAAVASTKTEHVRDAVAVVQFVKQRTDYVVQPRAQTTARHDTGTRVCRIEEKLRPRTRPFERE